MYQLIYLICNAANIKVSCVHGMGVVYIHLSSLGQLRLRVLTLKQMPRHIPIDEVGIRPFTLHP